MFEKNPNLQYETVAPHRITETRLVRNPMALLKNRGEATLLGSFGEASVLIDFNEEIVGGLEFTVVCTAPTHLRVH